MAKLLWSEEPVTSSAMHKKVMPLLTSTWNRCRSCAYDTRLRCSRDEALDADLAR